MSDIRFNRWLHQSGTGGVTQDSSGNVGIGSSVPRTALDVVGVVSATSFTGNLTGNVTGNVTGNITGNVNSTGVTTVTTLNIGTGTSISSPATNVLTLGTNNVERVRITDIGRVGIGTNIPAGQLDVRGSVYVDNNAVNLTYLIKSFSPSHIASSRGAKIRIGLDDGSFSGVEVENTVGSNGSFNSQNVHLINHNGGVAGDIYSLTARYDGKIGIGTTIPESNLDVYANDIVEGDAHGQIVIRDLAAYNANPISGIIFKGEHTPGSGAYFSSIYGGKENSTNGNYAGYLALATRTQGSTTAERLRIDSSGRMTLPYQPSFAARVATQQTNVTGNSVYFTLVADSTSSTGSTNVGSHYNTSTGIFTAPVTGRYYFNAHVLYDNSVLTRFGELWLSYNNDSTRWFLDRRYWASGSNITAIGGSVVINVTAGDNIRVRGFVSGGAQDVDVQGSSEPIAHFSGYLLG